uniref:Uncharacterized protein n=1 Tax=Sphaerodactylus townsendi TaxID=933632 RepID=A0ACB8EFG6_9SAUR
METKLGAGGGSLQAACIAKPLSAPHPSKRGVGQLPQNLRNDLQEEVTEPVRTKWSIGGKEQASPVLQAGKAWEPASPSHQGGT